MVITGDFRDYKQRLCSVTITTDSSLDSSLNINDSSLLYFSGSPIEINEDVDDSFETIIRKSATINLVTRQYLGSIFFANNSRSVEVEITREEGENIPDTILFSGYIDPNTFNQPFTSPLDSFSINCIDKLSTLQYYNYKDITVNNFEQYKATATNVTFKLLLDDVLDGLSFDDILYDKSKGLTSSRLTTIFNDLTISELNIIGEEADEVWTKETVLEEMLKYLNLHIRQIGNTLYIFDWDSIRKKKTGYYSLKTNTNITLSNLTVNLLSSMHADNGTNISIDDVYNQIQVTCNLNEQDTIIESPLDSADLSSLYTGKQLYMTEYISEGSGDHANEAFNKMVKNQPTTYDKCSTIDWFIQACNNKNWRFYYDGQNVVDSLAELSGTRYINQWKLAQYLKYNSCVPYIFKFGSIEHKGGPVTDNSPISKLDMSPYLYISINGNQRDIVNEQEPSDSVIQAHTGMIEYLGNNAGGVFSPNDDETTNYLVFSGKILLQPLQYESGENYVNRNNNFQIIYTNGAAKTEAVTPWVPNYGDSTPTQSNTIKSENNGQGRYYTRKFYTQQNPTDEPSTYLTNSSANLQPLTKDKSARGYEYNYSQTGDDGVDLYSKLPILECELIIGNKRLVETNMNEYGDSSFGWYPLGSEPTETIDGSTYRKTTFSLGCNPKIGDYIIGTEFDIQNTISYRMNIDAEGTAIPIKKSDALSGQVIFRILGPINSLWNNITKRHPTFWKHTTWSNTSHFILAHTENIIIKDFEAKIYSDNGFIDTDTNDSDLIYMSDETNDFISKKDDINFEFVTQLSSAECLEKGLNQSICLNAVINSNSGIPISTIYNEHETVTANKNAKPEEHFVNQYYLEYCQPKIIMESTLHDEIPVWNNIYHSNALSKDFYVRSISTNVRECCSRVIFKEV